MTRNMSAHQVFHMVWNGSLFDKDASLISAHKIDEKGFDGRLINQGEAVQNRWVNDFTIYTQGTVPVDYFLAGGFYDVVSESVRRTIQSATEKERVEFLPVKVVSIATNEKLEKYWVINVIESIDALDWEKTVWTTPNIPYGKDEAYSKIIKPVLKRNLMGNVHIFHLSVQRRIKSGIYISWQLKKALEDVNSRLGMEFAPIRVSDTS